MLANIPATQTVIAIEKPGGPEVLAPATRRVPEPKAGEVLIRIAAAGVNRADCLQRMGRYPMSPGAPDILGLQCSGTIVRVGEGVSQWREGDQVAAGLIAAAPDDDLFVHDCDAPLEAQSFGHRHQGAGQPPGCASRPDRSGVRSVRRRGAVWPRR